MSLCRMAAVKSTHTPYIDIVLLLFIFSGPLELFGSDIA